MSLTLRGDRVILRPIRADELDTLAEMRVHPTSDFSIPVPRVDRDWLRGRIERSGRFEDGELLFAVEADGRLVGEVQARQPVHGLPPGVFELGVELYGATDRGRGLGTEAIALITTRLFEEEGAHRVQAGTDLENAAMRGVFERLGFTLEGVMRSFMPTADGPRDYALYAITRDDLETTKDAWIPRS